jgi:hypothetical protein
VTLKVIGAGLGRTGTLSLKLALEKLGLGPCFHMTELANHPDRLPYWVALAEGKSVDWPAVFEGFQSTVDWPSCSFYRPLADFYPDAKVILTRRDPDAWYASTQQTIFGGIQHRLAGDDPWSRMVRGIIGRMFDGRFADRDHCVAVYERHNQEVLQSIPSHRLLDFSVAEGWAPLCRFLGVAEPAEPFPRVNSSEEFQATAAAMMEKLERNR